MRNYNTTQILLIIATLFSGAALMAQPACNQFNYYYADINYPSSGKQTDIYSVTFDAGVAALNAISEDLPYGGHIAYNEIDKLIYIVNDSDGSIQTLDPATGDLSAVISPAISLSQVSAATFSEDGKLLIGSQDANIYQVVFDGDPYSVSVFDGGGDISGGDLVFTNVGLYLASKPNGYFYAVLPGMYNVLLGYVTNQVTGLAKFEDGESVIVSGNGNSSFLKYDIDGSVTEIGSYAAMLNGEPFTLSNGDLTSGCSSFENIQEECANFQYFFISDNTPGITTGTVFGGNIVGGDFVMTSLFESGIAGHIAVNNNNGDIYVLRNNRVKTYSSTGDLLDDEIITGLPSRVESAVWNRQTNLLYVASASANKVYELDPSDGSHTLFASGIPVNGGDLVINNNDELFIVKRIDNAPSKLYKISGGSATFVKDVAPAINGAALTADGGFIMAEGDGSTNFHVYDGAGNPISVLNSVDNLGNSILIKDGDMASGCINNDQVVEPGCNSYSMFYTNFKNQSKSDIYRLDLNNDNTLTKTFLTELNFGSVSSAVSSDGKLYISSRFGNGFFIVWDVITNTAVGGNIPMTDESGNNIQEVGGSVFHNGLLYVTSLNGMIYALDPVTGNAVETITGISGQGSDILFDGNNNLWIVDRPAGTFHNLTLNTSFTVSITDIDGIALLPNGNFAAANGDFGSLIYEINPANGLLTGETFETDIPMQWGDLSGVCNLNDLVEVNCDYNMFLTRNLSQTSKLYRLELNNDNTLTQTLLTSVNFGSGSSAISPDGKLYICSRFGNGFFITWDVLSNTQIGGNIVMTDESGNNIQQVSGSVFHNGLLYVTSLDGFVYALNPTTGQAMETITGINSVSSDILFDANDELWIMDRTNALLINLTAGTSLSIPLSNVLGIALLANGNFAAANGDLGSLIYEINSTTGALTGVTFDAGVSMQYGDLSGICMNSDGLTTENGDCNATEVIEYIQGTSKSGGAIAGNRTDATKALGAPERAGQNIFVSLGYGGSLILAFDGAIPNGPGDDIEIVETSYGNPSCAAYPEYADVSVSVDGLTWSLPQTVCRTSGFIDISDLGTYDFVNFVKIVNNNDLSTTPDGFDVDGVVALHNCIEDDTPPVVNPGLVLSGQLTTYPNPTSGLTTIEFATVLNGKTTLEVLDMNGRVVKTLFSKDVEAGEVNKVNFDVTGLPNGIYITKMVTNNETVIDKIMIAR